MIIPACLPAHGHGTPAAHRSAPHPQAVAAARRWARSSPCTLRLCGRTRYVHRYLLYTLYFTLYTLYHPDNTGCIIQYYTIIRIIHNTTAFWPYCCTLPVTPQIPAPTSVPPAKPTTNVRYPISGKCVAKKVRVAGLL